MPEISPAFSLIGRGFAAYLAPPSPDVVRFTVGQPDFDTPETVSYTHLTLPTIE